MSVPVGFTILKKTWIKAVEEMSLCILGKDCILKYLYSVLSINTLTIHKMECRYRSNINQQKYVYEGMIK